MAVAEGVDKAGRCVGSGDRWVKPIEVDADGRPVGDVSDFDAWCIALNLQMRMWATDFLYWWRVNNVPMHIGVLVGGSTVAGLLAMLVNAAK